MSDPNNQQKQGQQEGMGCVGWVLEWAVFLLGAVLMFAKTSELLGAFAPKEWLGYRDIESIYGAVSALMVEGLFIAIKFANDPILSGKPRGIGQWLTNTIIMFVPFGISLLAQPLDAFVIQGTLVDQPVEIQLLVTWGVPMIPGLIVGMIMIKSLIENLPDEVTRKFGMKQGGGGISLPKIGDLGMFDPRNWFKTNGKDKRQGERRDAPPPSKPPKQDEKKRTETPDPNSQSQYREGR